MPIIATLLVLSAQPSLQNFTDLNLEFIVIAGVLLSLWAYKQEKPLLLGFGVLLAATKPQEVVLLLFLLGLFVLRYYPWRKTLKTALIPVSIFIVTTFLYGQAWLRNVAIRADGGITLQGMSYLYDIPIMLIWIIRICFIATTIGIIIRGTPRITRLGAGALVAASLIIAPYIAGLSHVTLFGIGLTTLVLKSPKIGILVFLLYFAPYLKFFGVEQFNHNPFANTYLFCANIISWTALLWFAHKEIQDYKLIDSTTKNEVINESNNRNIIR
ncbi:MAG: hypothetical protein Phog2KO_03730 [Phototrophicaceae bacterium]